MIQRHRNVEGAGTSAPCVRAVRRSARGVVASRACPLSVRKTCLRRPAQRSATCPMYRGRKARFESSGGHVRQEHCDVHTVQKSHLSLGTQGRAC